MYDFSKPIHISSDDKFFFAERIDGFNEKFVVANVELLCFCRVVSVIERISDDKLVLICPFSLLRFSTFVEQTREVRIIQFPEVFCLRRDTDNLVFIWTEKFFVVKLEKFCQNIASWEVFTLKIILSGCFYCI